MLPRLSCWLQRGAKSPKEMKGGREMKEGRGKMDNPSLRRGCVPVGLSK